MLYQFFTQGGLKLKEKTQGHRIFLAAFLLLLVLCIADTSSVHAALKVKKGNTAVRLTSQKRGWVKIGKDYYFYNARGRLMYGTIKYKGRYYYSTPNGKRFTGWMKRYGNKYYYNRKNGAMFRNRWATGTKYRYFFDKKGVAIARKWLTSFCQTL